MRDLNLSRRAVVGSVLALGSGAISAPGFGGVINDRMTGDLSPVHDPCMIKQGDTYYVFSTGPSGSDSGLIPWRTSKNLVDWKRGGAVFQAIPQWAHDAVSGARGIWAPDISLFNGRYHLYYAVSTFGSNRSVIGLATSATLDPAAPDHAWKDEGLVISSESFDKYNCIDPSHVVDRDGKHWLCFGSFWTGIKMIALDPATGKPGADSTVHSLAFRPQPPDAIEAPYMTEHDGYYYLFVSFDFCCRGDKSTYNIVAGRSKDVLGPFLGPDGKEMMHGYGQQVLIGSTRFKGPGGQSVTRDGERYYLVYHAYDAQNGGVPTLRVSPIGWTPDGWPSVIL
ncbi:MAG TPA: arabinan endo-1,5-alpha-L-arabinosidase [Rhizomicrobium sp.]|nr:arabinan endo-1,5-alpha-L-arabinosidase [Rhizomicrobium sp.]